MVLLVFCKYSYCQMFMIKCYKQHRHILYMKHETSIFVNEKLNTYIKNTRNHFYQKWNITNWLICPCFTIFVNKLFLKVLLKGKGQRNKQKKSWTDITQMDKLKLYNHYDREHSKSLTMNTSFKAAWQPTDRRIHYVLQKLVIWSCVWMRSLCLWHLL